MDVTTDEPIVDGWFSGSDPITLRGLGCDACGTRVFPPLGTMCPNPACRSDRLQPVDLARTGTVWSWAVNHYPPPAPYVAPDPFEPYVVVAVELNGEGLTVLGQLADAGQADRLTIGAAVEVVRGAVLTRDGGRRQMYAFQLVDGAAGGSA